jgi:hypothetical protein
MPGKQCRNSTFGGRLQNFWHLMITEKFNRFRGGTCSFSSFNLLSLHLLLSGTSVPQTSYIKASSEGLMRSGFGAKFYLQREAK